MARLSFPVTSAKVEALYQDMEKYHIREEDIEEQFVRGSGAGGQKINKTSSCVVLIHRPTGVVVRCQQSRSQALNRFLARRQLVDTIAKQIEGEKSAEQQRVAKIRRQKRRRSRRAKAKMLADKHHVGEKKALRHKPTEE